MNKHTRADAKAYARAHLRGIWAAALTPFNADLSMDEAGFEAGASHYLSKPFSPRELAIRLSDLMPAI